MITWMTRASFIDTAHDLDTALLLQTGEAVHDLLDAMMSEEGTADPAAHGWVGAEAALAAYGASLALALVTRGVTASASALRLAAFARECDWQPFSHPVWIEDTDILRSHRSNLVRRMPDRYRPSFPSQTPDWPYLWPVMDGSGGYDLVVSKADRGRLQTGERKLPSNVKTRITNL